MGLADAMARDTITVCSACLRAACWHGIFYCDEAWEPTTGTVEKPRAELIRLKLEHPDYWKLDR
jgi:hypothetical protein